MRGRKPSHVIGGLLGCASLVIGVMFFGAAPASAAAPLATTMAVGAVTSSTAVLNGTVTPNGLGTTWTFEYGTTTDYGLQDPTPAAIISSAAGPTAVTITVTGLTPGTAYDFQLVANSAGGLSDGGNLTFTTTGTAPTTGAPGVTTTAATGVTSTSATLNGTVNPMGAATTYYFEYGTSTTYGSVTTTTSAGSGTTAAPVTASLTGLTPGTTYDFQLVANNTHGTVVGGNQSFLARTGGTAPTVIAGSDAIGTSIAVSQQSFGALGAGGVVLARDDFFSDALAGGPMAAATDGPLLLTQGADEATTIDPRTLAEIERVLPSGGTVYILGGPLAISTNVDAQLTSAGFIVVRLAGADEYGTAVAIAQQLGNPATVFEATGLNFPDAESAVPAAIESNGAILLTNGTTQAPETAAYLAAHPTDVRYAIGGPLAAAGADPTAIAVYGSDEFATSAAVATRFFGAANAYGAATGLNFPDGLDGGVFMATGARSGPLLLVQTNAPLPAPIVAYLNTLPGSTPGYVFGGSLAVGPTVLTALPAALG